MNSTTKPIFTQLGRIVVLLPFAMLVALVLVAPVAAQVMGNTGDLPSMYQNGNKPLAMSPAGGLNANALKQSDDVTRNTGSGGAVAAGQKQAASGKTHADEQSDNVTRTTGTYGPVAAGQKQATSDMAIPPFGADLFNGGFRGPRASGLNPNYHILPGDRITLRVWGAVDISDVLPVDARGNIFIPYVGPVYVQGLANSQLNSRVKAAINKVFTDSVSVYTNLQGVQPVAVFVTGYVEKPGRYAGTPDSSILYFLDQASGIDEHSGSYRHIRIMRHGQTVARVDLYDFLTNGVLPGVQFQSGDTIVVGERGSVVTVAGEVTQPFRYELQGKTRSGKALLRLAQLEPGVTHALVNGVRADGPISRYVPLGDFDDFTLHAGDSVYFTADQHAESIVVQIEGKYRGPSHYVVPEDTTLKQLLNVIPVNPDLAAYRNIFIRRESIKERQKKALDASLRRLETTYLGASSATAEEAKIRVQEAQLIQNFVKRARQVKPTGQLVVSKNDHILDVRLEDGDEIVIPEQSNTILLTGEVLVPRAMVYAKGQDALDYIQRAGGFTKRANKDRVLIVRQNGEVLPAGNTKLHAGDEIMVLPEAPTKNLQLASTLSQILFQIAIATKTVLDI